MPFNRTAATRKLHILGKQKGLDHEALHEIAVSLFTFKSGEPSISNLTNAQLARFLQHLDGGPGPLEIKNPASHRQIWLIRKLAKDHGMDAPRLAGFTSRQCNGKTNLDELTPGDAARLIEGLKNLKPGRNDD